MNVWVARPEGVFGAYCVVELSESGEVLRIVADDLSEDDARLIGASPGLLEAAKTLLDVMLDRDQRGYDPATKAVDEARLRDAVLGMAAAVDKVGVGR